MRFKHFANKPYAVFNSLHREVVICTLSVSTLTFANTQSVSAQTEHHLADGEMVMQGIEVTGTRVPLTDKEAARMVTVLDRAMIESAPVQSVNDLLKYAAGIDVRQRGAMGIQTDLSIRGGTFDQITVLLNGVNISNPQTGHLTADFPVAIEDIERIEILEGPAARVFGTSAFCGAVNIVTSAERQKHIQAHATGGAYGLGGGGLRPAPVGKCAGGPAEPEDRSAFPLGTAGGNERPGGGLSGGGPDPKDPAPPAVLPP